MRSVKSGLVFVVMAAIGGAAIVACSADGETTVPDNATDSGGVTGDSGAGTTDLDADMQPDTTVEPAMDSSTGWSPRPRSVRLYSTFGGTTSYCLR